MSAHSGKRGDGTTRCGYNHSFRIDAESMDFITAYAKKNDRSLSWTVRMLVKRGLSAVQKLPVHEVP